MEIGKRFDDITSYNKSMSNAMEDKLFFIEKLPKEQDYIFFDFGCADGTMINNLIDYYGSTSKNIYIGYDCSETMISLAKTNFRENAIALFSTDWEESKEFCASFKTGTYKSVLILSSVIHEVYSYAKAAEEITEFWERVKSSGFDYIIIRDMMPRKNISRASSQEHVSAVVRKTLKNPGFEKNLKEFVKITGPISENKNLVHFLLKYHWVTNWKREVNENYFPIFLEDLLGIIKEPPYQMEYLESFKIPFLCDRINKFFGITLEDNTHVKLIFKHI